MQPESRERGRPPALLSLRDVAVSFGGLRALDGVSLEVAPGEILGLIGPNGAGKTTVFNVVCGFVRPDPGELRWDGRRLTAIRPERLARLGIARTLQGLGLFPHMSVLENVMVGATRHARAGFVAAMLGLSDGDERALAQRSLTALDRLGIADSANRLPGQLSYGFQKRVALARALVAEPRLLLLDEPASGLSEGELEELAGLIRSWRGDLAVILVEHHMDLVMGVSDRITVLDFGRVIAVGAPDEVRADPAVLDAYLGRAVGETPVTAGRATPAGIRQAALTVRGLTVHYGAVRALDDVSLTVAPGTVTAVLGANGAGKTTLLRAVNGLVRKQAGQVLVGERDVTGAAPEDVVRLGVSHVPEGRGVITELTVAENLRLGGLWRRDAADLRRATAEAYELFPPLAERRERPAATLSGGERQMLALGRALVSRPELLLLDEPSLGLAPRVTADIMAVVRDLRDTRGMAVLLVEQNARSALSIADHAVVLHVGAVVADAPAAQLADDETLRHAYLGF